MSKIYKGDTRITYYDLDCRGKLKLSALLRLVHIAADVNAADMGVGYGELSPLNMSFVLQRFGADIVRLPEYNETVTIRTWPSAVSSGVFTRKGDMTDAEGRKLMDWESIWVLFDIGARKILKAASLPVKFDGVDVAGMTAKAGKIFPDGGGADFSNYTHTVRYSEVDTNRHMNNSIYGDLIGNALFSTDDTVADRITGVQINFLAETRLGENVEVRCGRHVENGKSKFIVTGHVAGKNIFNAEVLSV